MIGTTFVGTLERVWLEGEENGWELCFETSSGVYRANAHGVAHGDVLADQLAAARAELLDWYAEGRQAAREHGLDLARRGSTSPEEAGYDPNDPKSPGYHDRMVGDA